MVRVLAVLALALTPTAVLAQSVTVLYDDRVIEIDRTLADPNDLWVVPEDLPRVNGFELKPEGACLDELCVPVRQDRDSEMFVTSAGQPWFSVTELARKLEQAFTVDHDHGVWSFGEIPVTRTAFLRSAVAPDFELPNREGEPVRLGFPWEEGPHPYLGLLVRLPIRLARVAGSLRAAQGSEL